MIGRAWFVLCLFWAGLLLGIAVWGALAAGDPPFSAIHGGLLFITVGPFFIPLLFRNVGRFIIGR